MSEPPSTEPDSGTDDEFAGIEPARPRKSPVLAIVTLLLAAVLIYHLRADLQFAFAAARPIDLGEARTLAARSARLSDNSFVILSGQPDRRNSLYIEPRGEKERQSFFRLLGTGDRIFVRAQESDAANPQDRWLGRLRRFDSQPYAETLRDHFGNLKVTRYLSLADFRNRVAGGSDELRDRRGELLTLDSEREVTVDVLSDEELVISMSKEKFPSEPDARHELDQMQLKAKPSRETKEAYEYVVAAPMSERNTIIEKLDKREIPFSLHDEQIVAPLGQIKLSGEVLTVGARSVTWAKVRAAGVNSPIVISREALVLTEGETPQSLRWVPVIVGLLLAFAAFNLWYLLRR